MYHHLLRRGGQLQSLSCRFVGSVPVIMLLLVLSFLLVVSLWWLVNCFGFVDGHSSVLFSFCRMIFYGMWLVICLLGRSYWCVGHLRFSRCWFVCDENCVFGQQPLNKQFVFLLVVVIVVWVFVAFNSSMSLLSSMVVASSRPLHHVWHQLWWFCLWSVHVCGFLLLIWLCLRSDVEDCSCLSVYIVVIVVFCF